MKCEICCCEIKKRIVAISELAKSLKLCPEHADIGRRYIKEAELNPALQFKRIDDKKFSLEQIDKIKRKNKEKILNYIKNI